MITRSPIYNVARSLTSSQYEFIERYTHLDENSKINSANAIIGILEQKKALRAAKLRVSF